ncbi:MAG: Asp-tRNA(Asn)/Glu-tRNA(Gln) amidotransferase subunit GatA [Patescibacteria group bacterium]|nr:Asp-tRNA(Asn)/Glu-tRNA(Gln) amidotransferase subunit GatA [Patescibacteria group bacterium]
MIKELHKKLQSKQITSMQLTKQYLDSIEEKDGEIHGYLNVLKDRALKNAQEVDEKIGKGGDLELLEGVPCAIKDNMCIAGTKTTAASKILENYVAPYDATVIEKLNQKGAVYLGKTNLDEFAMGSSTENSAFGVTKNPYDNERVAGGSSGGSAAAVGGNMAVWALGSDTGGSTRQPASFCGVVGFKPTYGRVSRNGLIAMASSYDQIGPITKTVEDAAIVFDAICGKDEKDNTTVEKEDASFVENLKPDLKGKKIGLVKEFFGNGLDGRVEKVVKEMLEKAEKNGAELVELEMPMLKHSLAIYYLMMPSEVSSNLARLDGIRYGLNESKKSKSILDVYLKSRKAGFGDESKRRIILGTYVLSSGYYDAYYKKAQSVRELVKEEFADAFEKVDVLVSPTSPTPAFKIGEKAQDPLEMYLTDVYTVSANVGMIPAISIPAGVVVEAGKKLPVGLQLMGKWWDEQNMLNVAAGFEQL